ncbi:MAG: PAC2 family protein [Nitrososphaeraceae archaeon]
MTELEIDKSMHRSIAQKMVEWTIDNECNLVISAAAIPYGNGDDNGSDDVYVGDNMPGKTKPPVYAVSSTQSAAKKIRDAGFSHLSGGTVTGIPGVLLNEGALTGLDVIVLIVNVVKDTPDLHAAAVISKAISKLVPGIYCDIGSLMADAQVAENRIKNIRESQSKSGFHEDI